MLKILGGVDERSASSPMLPTGGVDEGRSSLSTLTGLITWDGCGLEWGVFEVSPFECGLLPKDNARRELPALKDVP